jgi:hypothetical protein
MVPALKSRARINRRCRDEDVLSQLFFKHHKRMTKVRAFLRDEECAHFAQKSE